MLTMFTLSEVPSEKAKFILPTLQFNFMLTRVYFVDNNFAICVISHISLARVETLFKKRIFTSEKLAQIFQYIRTNFSNIFYAVCPRYSIAGDILCAQ